MSENKAQVIRQLECKNIKAKRYVKHKGCCKLDKSIPISFNCSYRRLNELN